MNKPQKETVLASSSEPEQFSDVVIPASIFRDRCLASLEVVVEYMKEKLNLSYHEIGVLLNRNERTIWTCYHRAKIKRKLPEKEENG